MSILRFGSIYGTNSNNFNTIKKLITQGIREKKLQDIQKAMKLEII